MRFARASVWLGRLGIGAAKAGQTSDATTFDWLHDPNGMAAACDPRLLNRYWLPSSAPFLSPSLLAALAASRSYASLMRSKTSLFAGVGVVWA